MRWKLCGYFALCFVQFTVHPSHGLVCPSEYKYNSGESCFRVDEYLVTWSAANAICESEGAMLASIDSSVTRDAIVSWVSATSANTFWIGLNDLDIEGVYRWQTNSVTSWSDWMVSPQQPDGSYDQNCISMTTPSGAWQDADCSQLVAFVCEYPRRYVNGSREATSECIVEPSVASDSWLPCQIWFYGMLLTLAEARDHCINEGGKLSVVDQGIINDLPGLGYLSPTHWTGLKRDGADTWRQEWDTCTPSLVRWLPSAPYMENKDCVVSDIINDQYWEVVDCNEKHSVICDYRKADACSQNAPSYPNADIIGYGVALNGESTVTYQCRPGYVFEGKGRKTVIDAVCDSCGKWELWPPPPCVVAPPYIPTTEESTIVDTTVATTLRLSTLMTSDAETTVVTTEAETTIVSTEAETTVVTTEAETTAVTTEGATTVATTEAETTVATTEVETTVVTTEGETTVISTEAEPTVVNIEAETTVATTEAETTVVTTEAETTVVTTETETTVVTTETETTVVTTEAETNVFSTEPNTTVVTTEGDRTAMATEVEITVMTSDAKTTVTTTDAETTIPAEVETTTFITSASERNETLGNTTTPGSPTPSVNSGHSSLVTNEHNTSVSVLSFSTPPDTFIRFNISTTLVYPRLTYQGPHCPPIPTWEGATSNTSSRYPGTYVEYHCVEGRYFDSGAPYERTFCLPDGEWRTPLLDCKGENRSFYRTDPTPVEAPGAVAIGTSSFSILILYIILIIILDIDTYVRHFKLLRQNVSWLCRRHV